tara:strand:- start:388 stop:1161 length:774 start_codon:yes stop_codon:yes gene_type:complete
VLVEQRRAKPSTKLKSGQVVTVLPALIQESNLEPQSIDLNIIYEDSHILVIDKQAGIPVHPGPGHPDGTIANALLEIYPNVKRVGSEDRPGIVHRLDIDTSGLMVVARTQEAHLNIARQFENRTVEKTYLALVTGTLAREEAIIDAAIGRSPGDRQRMSVLENGRQAITRYKVIRRYTNFDLLEIRLLTGRTHQIRVHMASLGHPVAGDKIYGREFDNLARQFLHSAGLQFSHPDTAKRVKYEAPLPGDISQFLNFC